LRVPKAGRRNHGVCSALVVVDTTLTFYHYSTCFWAGDTFAPKLKIPMLDGQTKSVQQYLQDAFLDMYTTVIHALDDLDGIIGFEASLGNFWHFLC
jgi:Cdc6-like AAA superfamily ATPase